MDVMPLTQWRRRATHPRLPGIGLAVFHSPKYQGHLRSRGGRLQIKSVPASFQIVLQRTAPLQNCFGLAG